MLDTKGIFRDQIFFQLRDITPITTDFYKLQFIFCNWHRDLKHLFQPWTTEPVFWAESEILRCCKWRRPSGILTKRHRRTIDDVLASVPHLYQYETKAFQCTFWHGQTHWNTLQTHYASSTQHSFTHPSHPTATVTWISYTCKTVPRPRSCCHLIHQRHFACLKPDGQLPLAGELMEQDRCCGVTKERFHAVLTSEGLHSEGPCWMQPVDAAMTCCTSGLAAWMYSSLSHDDLCNISGAERRGCYHMHVTALLLFTALGMVSRTVLACIRVNERFTSQQRYGIAFHHYQ